MQPIIQIDLDFCKQIRQITDINFPTGLLQAFMPIDKYMGEDVFIRVIPRESVSKKLLTETPKFVRPKYEFVPLDWTDPDYEFNHAIQITGVKKPHFTMQKAIGTFEDTIGQFDIENDPIAQELVKLLEFADNNWRPAGNHFFGTFYPIQYDADTNEIPIMCLDCEGPFIWGDSGTAQIFYYKLKNNDYGFRFDWSCY